MPDVTPEEEARCNRIYNAVLKAHKLLTESEELQKKLKLAEEMGLSGGITLYLLEEKVESIRAYRRLMHLLCGLAADPEDQ
jgi:hypothetical protein